MTISSDVEMDGASQTTGCVINKMIVKTCLMSSIAVSRRARLWCFDSLSKPLSEIDCFNCSKLCLEGVICKQI